MTGLTPRRRRRLAHIVGFTTLSAVGVAVLHVVWPRTLPFSQEASLSLAYVSFAALAMCLIVGPLNVLRRAPNPRSNDLRRDLGLWSAATASAHVVFSVQHHFGGRVAFYFFDNGNVAFSAIRRDKFGLANWIGVAATLIVLVLALTSSDAAIRLLGRRWKQVQRWAYVLGALVVAHTVLFWNLETRAKRIQIAASVAIVVVLGLQSVGAVLSRRRGRVAVEAGG